MRIAIALVLLAACGSKGSEDKARPGEQARARPAGSGGSGGGSGGGAAPADNGLARLAVKLSGKPVAIERALVKRMEPDRYQIYLSSHGGACRELLDNVFESKDRLDVLASVSPRLNADGKQYLQITDVFEGAPTLAIAPGAKVSITGAADAGEPVQVALDFVATAQDAAAKGLSVEVHGAFTAEGCGARPPGAAGVPKAPHPTTAAITIARQRLELKGAIVKGSGKTPDLVLSTAPKDCSPATPAAAVILERTGGRWRATGTWLEQEITAATKVTDKGPDKGPDRGPLAAALGAAGKSEDGPTVALALSGAGDLGGFPVALEGTIEALACK